jgi:hypothetical protein
MTRSSRVNEPASGARSTALLVIVGLALTFVAEVLNHHWLFWSSWTTLMLLNAAQLRFYRQPELLTERGGAALPRHESGAA